jgi:hypothetical protein
VLSRFSAAQYAAMSVSIHRDVDFQGPFALLRPGFYSGKDLVGCPHQSTSCEDLDNAVNSIRVDPNVIVALADGYSISASGGGARVLIGPVEVSDLTALGMNNRISSLLIVQYRAYDSAIPAPAGGVELYDSYGRTGRRSFLRRGDYPPARLASEEVRMPGQRVVSLAVEPHVVAVLYNGDAFETTKDAVMVVGPTVIEDLERLGMHGRVNSIRVLYSDPFDVPGRPVLPLGTARDYTPGGGLGYTPGPRRHERLLAAESLPLSRGAREFLIPSSADPSDPSNWAGGLPAATRLPQPAAQPPPQQQPLPQVIIIREPAPKPSGRFFVLIVIFIIVVAFAAYASARATGNPAKRMANEANLVAQAGVPLAVTAALI